MQAYDRPSGFSALGQLCINMNRLKADWKRRDDRDIHESKGRYVRCYETYLKRFVLQLSGSAVRQRLRFDNACKEWYGKGQKREAGRKDVQNFIIIEYRQNLIEMDGID